MLTPQGSLSLGRRVHLWVGGAGWGPGFPAPGGWRTPRTHFQGHSPGLWVTEKPGIPPPPAHPPCILPASVTHHCCHGNPASRAHDFRADGEELGLAAWSCSKGLGQLAKWQRKRGSRLAGAAPCSKTRGGPRPRWGAEGRVGGAPRLPDRGGRGPRRPGLAVGASVSLSPKQDRPQTARVCVCEQHLLGTGVQLHIFLEPLPRGPDWLGRLWGACHVGPTCQHQLGSPRHLLCARGCHGDGPAGRVWAHLSVSAWRCGRR